MRWLTAATVVTALTCNWSGPAWAEVESARERFMRGVELFQDAAYEEALADFARAYELAPHYGLLYNIGLVQAHLRDYPAAVTNLESYLEQGGDEIDDRRREQVERELERLRGLVAQVRVQAEGLSEATITVDGDEVVDAALGEPITVAAGRRVIGVRADGFLPSRREVTVAGGVEVEVSFDMVRASSSSSAIIISSDLDQLTVTVDGDEVGLTPLDAPVVTAPGRHVVEASRPGYEPVGRVVEVDEGDFITLELDPEPMDQLPAELSGRLELEVSEPEAEVLVDGAPLDDAPVPVGPHVVEVRRAGFETFWTEVDVAADEATTVAADLRPTETYLSDYTERARRWRLAASLTLGLGLALLGTDLGLYLWNRGRHLDWVSEYAFLIQDAQAEEPDLSGEESRTRYDRAEALGNKLESWSAVMWATLGLGVASIITSVVLFVLGPDPDRYDRFTLSPVAGGAVVGWSRSLTF